MQIWSNNLSRRLKKEIRRGTDSVGVFFTREAILSFVGDVMVEQTDKWGRPPLLRLDVLARSRFRIVSGTSTGEIATAPLHAQFSSKISSYTFQKRNYKEIQ